MYAQFELGRFYWLGKGGLAENETEALRWCLKAAEQGHPGAQSTAGRLLGWGRGGPEDVVEAYKWLSLSVAKRPHEKTSHYLHEVEKKMTYAEIAEAKKRAKNWRPK